MRYYKLEDYYVAYSHGNNVFEFYINNLVPCLWAGYGEVDFLLEGCKEITANEYLTALDKALKNGI